MATTNITDFDPATGLTTTTLVECHDRGSKDYYCIAGGGTGCFDCGEETIRAWVLPADVDHFTIEQIKSWVDDHENMAQTVYDRESARGDYARSTLLEWLRGFIDANDDDDRPGGN